MALPSTASRVTVEAGNSILKEGSEDTLPASTAGIATLTVLATEDPSPSEDSFMAISLEALILSKEMLTASFSELLFLGYAISGYFSLSGTSAITIALEFFNASVAFATLSTSVGTSPITLSIATVA